MSKQQLADSAGVTVKMCPINGRKPQKREQTAVNGKQSSPILYLCIVKLEETVCPSWREVFPRPGAVSATTDGKHSHRGRGGIPTISSRHRDDPPQAFLSPWEGSATEDERRLTIDN